MALMVSMASSTKDGAQSSSPLREIVFFWSSSFAIPSSSAVWNCRRVDGKLRMSAEELARGELREETGFDASSMVYLGMMYIAYGFANPEAVHLPGSASRMSGRTSTRRARSDSSLLQHCRI